MIDQPPMAGEQPAPPYLPEARWTLRHAVALLAAWLVGVFVGSIASVALFEDPLDPRAVFMVVVPIQSAAMLIAAGYLSRTRGTGDWRRDFGLTLQLRDAWLVVAGIGLQIVAALITAPFVEAFGGPDPPEQQVAEVVSSASAESLVFAFIGVVVLAPLVEEILYRGVLLHWLRSRLSKHPAALLSGAIFAAVHLVDPNTLLLMPGLFAIGSVLSYSALKHGSLSRPIFLHAGVNLAGLVIGRYGQDVVDYLERLQDTVEALIRLAA